MDQTSQHLFFGIVSQGTTMTTSSRVSPGADPLSLNTALRHFIPGSELRVALLSSNCSMSLRPDSDNVGIVKGAGNLTACAGGETLAMGVAIEPVAAPA
jgi:hypothetical protein